MFYEVLAPMISQTITFYSCDIVGTILYYLLLKFLFWNFGNPYGFYPDEYNFVFKFLDGFTALSLMF